MRRVAMQVTRGDMDAKEVLLCYGGRDKVFIPVEILDKIRAEIQTKIKEENYGVISDHTHEDGLEEALEIIDKYREEWG